MFAIKFVRVQIRLASVHKNIRADLQYQQALERYPDLKAMHDETHDFRAKMASLNGVTRDDDRKE